MSERYLSIAECAALLSVHAKTVRGLIARGELRALKVGRVLRIDPADLEGLRYQPADTKPRAGARFSPPRPARGEFARLARASDGDVGSAP